MKESKNEMRISTSEEEGGKEDLGDESDQEKLREIILTKSSATTWEKAKREWSLHTIICDKPNNCICGHRIRENCIIQNSKTGKKLVVGNVCINQFKEENLNVDLTAQSSLHSLRRGTSKTANQALLKLARRIGVLNEIETRIYSNLTTGQGSRISYNEKHEEFNRFRYNYRELINRLIILGFNKNRPKCHCNPSQYAKPRQGKKVGTFVYSCGKHKCSFNKNIK